MNQPAIGKRSFLPLMSALLLVTVMSAPLSAQSITGSYELVSVSVQYLDVLRDTAGSDAVGDDAGSYDINLNWPSSLAAAAGQGFSYPVANFTVGDTVAAPSTPAAFLSPEGLAAYTIDLTLALDDANGTMLIPASGTGTSSYPTTRIEACSTFAVILAVTDNATIELSTNVAIDTTNSSVTWGLGIDQSDVFAWFQPADPLADPTTWPENWGMITAYYSDNTFAILEQVEVNWRAIDGSASALGVDDAGNLNRMLGVSVLDGSDDFVGQMELAFQLPAGTFNQGTYPALVPPGAGVGIGLPADSIVSVNHAYLFDPVGDDGVPMNGDEPLQFTGYYFTYNLLIGLQALGDAFDSFEAEVGRLMLLGLDQATATVAAFDTTVDLGLQAAYVAYGVEAATAAAVAGAVASTVTDSLVIWLSAGGDPEDTIEEASKFALGYAVGAMKLATSGAFDIDDSDHDFDGTDGRLVFEVGNDCMPVIETQIVNAIFYADGYISVEQSIEALPTTFALHDNYPNPFNPTTSFSIDMPNASEATVTIWNILGQKVRTLYSGVLAPGTHVVTFDGRDNAGNAVPSGVYFYRVATPTNTATRKMMLLK